MSLAELVNWHKKEQDAGSNMFDNYPAREVASNINIKGVLPSATCPCGIQYSLLQMDVNAGQHLHR